MSWVYPVLAFAIFDAAFVIFVIRASAPMARVPALTARTPSSIATIPHGQTTAPAFTPRRAFDMAEIVQFPTRAPRPALRLVCDIDDLVAAAETTAKGHKFIASAMESMASASLELNNAYVILLDRGGDVADLVSEESIISICHALIALIDAKGCRNEDRALRNAAARTIADREGANHEH
jgi:hypothetical protein